MTALPMDFEPTGAKGHKRVLMRGTVFAPDGAHVVWIRDIAEDGALVTCDTPLPKGRDVIFKRGPIFAAAFVDWTKATSASLKFYRPVDEHDLLIAAVPVPGRDH